MISVKLACCVLRNVTTRLIKAAFSAFGCLLGAVAVIIPANPELRLWLQLIVLAEVNARFPLVHFHL